MLLEGYPEYEYHKNLHLQLIDNLSSRVNMIEIINSEKEFTKLIDFLLNWFFHHTANEDKLFADYVFKKNIYRPKSAK